MCELNTVNNTHKPEPTGESLVSATIDRSCRYPLSLAKRPRTVRAQSRGRKRREKSQSFLKKTTVFFVLSHRATAIFTPCVSYGRILRMFLMEAIY